jgi:hypothetical protein
MRWLVWALTLVFAAIGFQPAFAIDRLQVRPGMSLGEITRILKPKCLDYQVGGTGEKYVTCVMGEGRTPAVVTVTVTQRDRAEYIQWRDLVGPTPPNEHASVTARELGFSGAKAECERYKKFMACWSDGSGTILYDAGHEAASGIYTFYLDNDAIRKADAK